MKKSLSILLALACAVSFSFTSCTKKADGKLKIGIIQLVEHVALDQSYQGFVDGLKEAGYEDGKNIVIDTTPPSAPTLVHSNFNAGDFITDLSDTLSFSISGLETGAKVEYSLKEESKNAVIIALKNRVKLQEKEIKELKNQIEVLYGQITLLERSGRSIE